MTEENGLCRIPNFEEDLAAMERDRVQVLAQKAVERAEKNLKRKEARARAKSQNE